MVLTTVLETRETPAAYDACLSVEEHEVVEV